MDSGQPGQRRIAAGAIIVSLLVVVTAERDLHARPATAIRGSRRAWQLGCTNAAVALAYLRWGRRDG